MAGMRVLIDVRDEDVQDLRAVAVRDHRSVREQAGYLLHLKIREEAQRLGADRPEAIGEVA